MNRLVSISLAASGVLLLSSAAYAHHSFRAVFDKECLVAFEGKVTKVSWANPHVWFYVDAPQSKGKAKNWALELGSPNGLARRGWRRDTLKVGEAVAIKGYCARNGKPAAAAATVKLSDGRELFGAQPITD